MNAEKFEKDMAVFSDKHHHEMQNYFQHLKLCGWTVADAVEWSRLKREKDKLLELEVSEEMRQKICDECNSTMYLQTVNSSPQDQTGDPADTFVWFCSNKNCMHTIYIQDTLEQIKARGK
jgi:hypothetical protein